jgi:hypothetical protein
MRNTAMVNGRITAKQMEWLQQLTDELGGNLSAALRQTITDARLLEKARADYRALLEDHPGFEMPRLEPSGTSRLADAVLLMKLVDPEDVELREQEKADAD